MDAAKHLYAERGLQVGFDEIARHAGVGVGTVYRRFPDRDALFEALFLEKVTHIDDILTAAAAIADPWAAVVYFCENTVKEQQRDRGLMQVVAGSGLGGDRIVAVKEQMAAHVGTLLRRAQDAGKVRADLAPADLVLLTHLCSRIAVDDDSALWRRYLSLILDGIRARPHVGELPGPPPTIATFEQVANNV